MNLESVNIPVDSWVTVAVAWMSANLGGFFDAVSAFFSTLTGGLEDLLLLPQAIVLILILGLIAWYAKGWKFAILTILSFALIAMMGMWESAMSTLALVLVSALAALVVGVPLGILASFSKRLSAIIKPVLDFMQTMPSLVYLIPSIIFFGIGTVPGVVSTILFAMPPAARMTELGIRQVDPEVVEAGKAFGASPAKILGRIQIPLALPTIMAGVNQVIMLSLSMVVIAGMVGAGGLGAVVYGSVTRLDVGLGFEGGLAVVIIAVFLDRITAAFGKSASKRVSRGRSNGHHADKREETFTKTLIARRTFIVLSAAAVGAVAFGIFRTNDTSSSAEGSSSSGKGTIKIGWIPWDEDVSATYLWKRILENNGYTVTLTQADAGPVYEALSTSDLDVFLDTWLPTTHADYWATYKDKLEDLSVWYDNARLTWAVPNYVDIDSIPDLAGHGTEFGNQIIGIEPGAGLTRVSNDTVLPGYGLGGEYSLVESSTTAMLSELSRAISSNKPIVVTLWRPHWAYSSYPIKDLEDPDGLLGAAEQVHIIARDGFSDDYPEVAGWLEAFVLDDTQLAALEDMVMNQYGSGQEEAAIDAWLDDDANKALVDGWLAG